MTDWKLISENPPKDGVTACLVCVTHPLGRYVTVATYIFWEGGGEEWCIRWGSYGLMAIQGTVTHWAPHPGYPS